MHLLMAHGSSEERERSYLRLFEQQRVAGIIIAPIGDVESELARIRTHGIPSVVITQQATSTAQASVSTDHALGGRIAVQHLIGQGRRRLGFVTDDLDDRQVQDQLRGALEALGSAPGVALEVVRATNGTLNAGVACAEAIAQRPHEERPDGLFCVNGILAIGVAQVFAAGPSTRELLDVAIVGYDATALAPLAAAPFTAVRVPHREMGVAAVNLLFDQISQSHQGEPRLALSPALTYNSPRRSCRWYPLVSPTALTHRGSPHAEGAFMRGESRGVATMLRCRNRRVRLVRRGPRGPLRWWRRGRRRRSRGRSFPGRSWRRW